VVRLLQHRIHHDALDELVYSHPTLQSPHELDPLLEEVHQWLSNVSESWDESSLVT
jgi:hypothetical protein